VEIQRVEPDTERSVETQLATQGRVSAGAFSKKLLIIAYSCSRHSP